MKVSFHISISYICYLPYRKFLFCVNYKSYKYAVNHINVQSRNMLNYVFFFLIEILLVVHYIIYINLSFVQIVVTFRCFLSYIQSICFLIFSLEVMEQALSAGFSTAEDYRNLWLGYLEYMRRRVDWNSDHDTELTELRETFNRACEYLAQCKYM